MMRLTKSFCLYACATGSLETTLLFVHLDHAIHRIVVDVVDSVDDVLVDVSLYFLFQHFLHSQVYVLPRHQHQQVDRQPR